ncbi:MAG: hypothetical protein R2845_14600 [Thermomicrobiales bacterium]
MAHVGIADPFCAEFSQVLSNAAVEAGHPAVSGGTYVCIEGPQFSTKAESNLFRSWGASIIGMTAMPEARLAREAELCYASLSMVTDFDVWHEEEEPVTVEVVRTRLSANSEAAKAIITALASRELTAPTCSCGSALATTIVTDPASVTGEQRARLAAIAGRYLGRTDSVMNARPAPTRWTEIRLLIAPAVMTVIGLLTIVLVPRATIEWAWSDIWVGLAFGGLALAVSFGFGIARFTGDQLMLPLVTATSGIGLLMMQRLSPASKPLASARSPSGNCSTCWSECC